MYKSTRGQTMFTASEAILRGIAPDGGLYVTAVESAPYEEWVGLEYQELAKKVFSHLLDDYSSEEIAQIVEKSYTNTFETSEVVNLKNFNDVSFLETFHGPTKAFKDVALSALPNLLRVAKVKQNKQRKTIILTATSGDTGSAALQGFKGQENIEIIVLYPNNRVSRVQEAQMNHYQGGNCHVIAVNGNFDDCQTAVKELLNDKDINGKYDLSSANSINIGRLIPQVVYYFYAYNQLVKKQKITVGEKVNFCVPTGNFGDILAGYYANKMGLPINKLICASNQNKVLTDFFSTNVYDINRSFTETCSPSMDILISSNFERLVYDFVNGDETKVVELMSSLKKEKKYTVNNPSELFAAGYATETETVSAITDAFKKYQYVIDPHTAVAYKVYNDYAKQTSDKTQTVIISTASPFKFVNSVSKALGLPVGDEYQQMDDIASMGNVDVPKVFKILQKEELHKIVWEKEDVKSMVKKLLVEVVN